MFPKNTKKNNNTSSSNRNLVSSFVRHSDDIYTLWNVRARAHVPQLQTHAENHVADAVTLKVRGHSFIAYAQIPGFQTHKL